MTADTAAWRKSACILCENNCGIQIQTDGRRFTKIRGDKEHVATAGYTCNKALRLDHYQNGGARLPTPLRREPDGSFTPIDWDTAIREIAARLKTVRDTHGGESIFFYGGVALNTLTDPTWRDAIAGTPWHKHVPARIQPFPPDEHPAPRGGNTSTMQGERP
jgi:anaerobic selenocysteine-containing dehydrogenase